MVYLMVVLTMFVLFLLVRNYRSHYVKVLIPLVLSINLCIFVMILLISKNGQYFSSSIELFWLDYQVYLFFSQINLPQTTMSVMFNSGVSIFLTVLIFFFWRLVEVKTTIKKILMILSYLFPVLNWILYHPEFKLTIYLEYQMLLQANEFATAELFKNVVIFVVLLFRVVFIIYLYSYTALSIKQFIKQEIWLLKRRNLTTILCFSLLCSLFYLLVNYIYSDYWDKLLIVTLHNVPQYVFTTMPILILLATLIVVFIMFKWHVIEPLYMFSTYRINNAIRQLNREFRSQFHSFKNNYFSIKITAMQALNTDSVEEKNRYLQKIFDQSDTSLNSMTKILNSLQDILPHRSNNRCIDLINDALNRAKTDDRVSIIVREKNESFAFVDSVHMINVLVNLIDNAVEAAIRTDREPFIEIITQSDADLSTITVCDNGAGFEKNTLRHLYKPVYSDKNNLNWGVGLNYAFRLTKANGGVIRCAKTSSAGTQFELTLPRYAE